MKCLSLCLVLIMVSCANAELEVYVSADAAAGGDGSRHKPYQTLTQARDGIRTLRKAGIETLMVCGIVTNGGVASTVRDAHVRDFSTFVLSDGCAAFSRETHERAIGDLSTVAKTVTCSEAADLIAGA